MMLINQVCEYRKAGGRKGAETGTRLHVEPDEDLYQGVK